MELMLTGDPITGVRGGRRSASPTGPSPRPTSSRSRSLRDRVAGRGSAERPDRRSTSGRPPRLRRVGRTRRHPGRHRAPGPGRAHRDGPALRRGCSGDGETGSALHRTLTRPAGVGLIGRVARDWPSQRSGRPRADPSSHSGRRSERGHAPLSGPRVCVRGAPSCTLRCRNRRIRPPVSRPRARSSARTPWFVLPDTSCVGSSSRYIERRVPLPLSEVGGIRADRLNSVSIEDGGDLLPEHRVGRWRPGEGVEMTTHPV